MKEVLPAALSLKRDQLWQATATRPQLEFVVDNKALAQLLNLEICVDNPLYEDAVAKMRDCTYLAFAHYFDYKTGVSFVP